MSSDVRGVLEDLVAQAGAVASYAAESATGLSSREVLAIERLWQEAAAAASNGEYVAAIELCGRVWAIAGSGGGCE